MATVFKSKQQRKHGLDGGRMEEESFQLLSSMSPNVKHCQKHFRKGTTVLALRKSLQKSSIYDKSIHTEKNDKIIVTEIISSSTSQSSKSTKSSEKLLNTTPISIHDSDSEKELKFTSSKNILIELPKSEKNSKCKVKNNFLLSQDKFEIIKHWVDNVNLQSEVKNISTVSAYSELSTIYGEENGKNFITERTGRAVNSTGIEPAPINFDELFKKETGVSLSARKNGSDIDDQLVINESYIKQGASLTKSIQGNSIDFRRDTVSTIDETNFISNSEKSVISSSSRGLDRKNSLSSIHQRNINNSIEQTEVGESDEGMNNSRNSFSLNENFNRNALKGKESNKGLNHKKSVKNVYKRNTNKDHIQVEVSASDEDINDSDNSFSLNESLNTRLRKSKNKNISTSKSQTSDKSNRDKNSGSKLQSGTESNGADEQEVASMLDDLYGHKWREKEEHVLFKTPKTEPRKHVSKLNNVCITNSERKPKLSVLYKNPYLETEKTKSYNLLITLQKSRLKNNVESPAIKRLNDFCDSETDSNSDAPIKPRGKLNFNDSDCEDETTSKYFRDTLGLNKKTAPEPESKKENESDKENFNSFSFLGQSLEDRICKKINGIKDVPGSKRNKKKNSNDKMPLTKRCDTNSNKTDKKIDKVTKKEEKKTDNRKLSLSSISSDDTWEEEISKIIHESKPINGKYSFLASLSANIPILQCDMSARIYRNNFKLYKEQLLTKLFKLYNEKVFENAIPQDTALEWNDRMRGTAGFCYCKKITRRTGAVERTARIVLSTKVIDAAYRLRDTLIHEMCHAATWIVNCISDGHGPYWKSWACKAMKTFPELPPIKRCHDYVINTKYTYKCTGCGYSIGRHSKSLDIERKRCGYCLGKFEVLLNKVSKKGETKSVPATPKKEVTGFALFVKENYSVYKKTNLKHGDVMKLLGQKFQEMKLKAS